MTLGPAASEIEIRHCTTLEEYEECVRIEHLTWGPELAEPSGMFVVARHTGGQTFAAFDGAQNGRVHDGGGGHPRRKDLSPFAPDGRASRIP